MDNEVKDITDKKLKYLLTMNEKIQIQVNYAETKNGILLGLLGAAIFGLAAFLFECLPLWLWIYLLVVICFFGIALLICILSFMPNLKTLKNGTKKNLYYFGHIAKLDSVEEYDKMICNFQDEVAHIEEQNIYISQIALKKHRLFRIAINFIFAGITLPIYIIYLLIKCVKNFRAKKSGG